MSGPLAQTSSAGIWGRGPNTTPGGYGSTNLGGGGTGLPVVTNTNLPSNTLTGLGSVPPPVPRTPFPTVQTTGGPANSLGLNNYATANTAASLNANSTNEVGLL